jgi:beta-glucosidase
VIRIALAVFAFLSLLAPGWVRAADAAPAGHDEKAMQAFVDGLLQRMTVEEKVGQLTILGTDRKDLEQLIREGEVGGTNGVLPNTDVVAYTHRMQQLAMQSRLKIPLWFMGDVCHGFATVFPVPLAMAATWDTALVERVDRAAAVEATAAGVDWTFCPMVDISRDPRWGRVVEGAGEDPFLGSAMAAAQVRGFQGDDLSAPDTMLATVKHFAGYGAVQAGRDYNSVWIPPREFRDVYLPPYHAAVGAGAGSVMAAFVALDYVPATADRALLTGILRNQWGFKGLVVSDYDAVLELEKHGIARDAAEAARLALHAGVDVDLHSGTYLRHLPSLVRSGKVPEAEVDAAVRRVLVAKYKIGLFADPFHYGDGATAKRVTRSPQHRALARKAARESMVLLENRNGTLPLQRRGRVAVIGPLAEDRGTLQGPMAALGKPGNVVTILDGIREVAGRNVDVAFAKGVDVASDDTSGIAAAVNLAKSSDVAVLVLGEGRPMIGEGNSRAHIDLPGRQLELAKAVKAAGVPIVVVLVNGRPLTLPWLHEHADAVLEAWLPGDEGGHAVADLLFGDGNPSGKLPMTFPRTLGQVPIHYAHLETGRPFNPASPAYTSRYVDEPNSPLYPFGYGLSYTTFAFGPVHLDSQTLTPDGTVNATVRVSNTGKRAGTEVVQLYIRDEVADVSRPVRQLRGFQRVTLAPGESRNVTFKITPAMLAFHRLDMTLGTEPGGFEVYVGGNSQTTNRASFTLTSAAGGEHSGG